jgi:hypothetical protein
MPRKKKNEPQKGLWTIFGLKVNLNSVLTAVFGSVACTLVGWMLLSIHNFMGTAKVMMETVPIMTKDVRLVEKELRRLANEYPPLPPAHFDASLKTPAKQ